MCEAAEMVRDENVSLYRSSHETSVLKSSLGDVLPKNSNQSSKKQAHLNWEHHWLRQLTVNKILELCSKYVRIRI
jgi:hypothetical protein